MTSKKMSKAKSVVESLFPIRRYNIRLKRYLGDAVFLLQSSGYPIEERIKRLKGIIDGEEGGKYTIYYIWRVNVMEILSGFFC